MANYENLLKEAYSKVKQVEGDGERFEVPKVQGRFEGKKTIVTNICQISDYIRRKPEHMIKFLVKGLATQGKLEKDRLILNNKIPSGKINKKIGDYVKDFVICKECKKPDTEIRKEDRLTFIHCLACGANHPVREKI